MNSMIRTLLKTDDRIATALTRFVLGAVLLPHGAQKLLGWFGGYGFSGTMNYFTGTVHMPWLLGFSVIVVETAGALALLAGFAQHRFLWIPRRRNERADALARERLLAGPITTEV